MRAGRRNTKVLIESKTSTINSYGDPVDTWATFSTQWVEIASQSGKEFLNAKEQNSSVSMVLTSRYVDGVTPEMRINYGGRYFNILAVFDPFNNREQLKIYCDEQL